MNQRSQLGLLAVSFAASLLVGGNVFVYSSATPSDDNDFSNNGSLISRHVTEHHSTFFIGDTVLPPLTAELSPPVLARVSFLVLVGIFLVLTLQAIARGPPKPYVYMHTYSIYSHLTLPSYL